MRKRLEATILQVIPELETGGAERTTLEVAEAVINAGGKAIVASQGGPLVNALERLGARHVTLPVASKNPITMYLNAGRLTKLARDTGADLIHARSRAPAWSAWKACQNLNLPFITTYHGAYRAKGHVKRRYNSIMARGDYVIANSDFTRCHVLHEHSPDPVDKPERLITIHRGADLRRFDPESVSEERIQVLENQWEGRDALKILLPGRLTAWKGQETLIKAAQILRITRQALPVRIVLAGSDQGRSGYLAELRTAIKDADVEHIVTIPGNCLDMPAAYAWADLAVSASTRPEAFGRVAIEAQAMRCPVIATDHGGARETVLHEKTGYLVPPGDAGALASAISEFADLSTERRDEMARAARRNAETRFSIEKMTDATLDVYIRALSGNNSLGNG